VLLYVTAPFVQSVRNGILIEAVLMTLVLLSAVLAVSGRRRTLAWAMVFAVPALVEKWVNYWQPDLLPPKLPVDGLAFIGFIVLRLLGFILRRPGSIPRFCARVSRPTCCWDCSGLLRTNWWIGWYPIPLPSRSALHPAVR